MAVLILITSSNLVGNSTGSAAGLAPRRIIRDEVLFAYRGHHQFDWVRPRQTWLEAASPVYIDLGEDYLLKMETYDDSGLPCVRVVMKRDFVASAMEETDARSVLRYAVTKREAEEQARARAARPETGA